MKITKKTKIMELVNENPNAIEILFNAGLMCVGCGMAQNETLEQGMKAHGFSDKEIGEVIKELNNLENKK